MDFELVLIAGDVLLFVENHPMNLLLKSCILLLYLLLPLKQYASSIQYFEVVPIEGKIRLSWTAYLDEPATFMIERSTDNRSFITIDSIAGLVFANEEGSFSFDDEQVENGTVYYYRVYFRALGEKISSQTRQGETIREQLLISEFYPNPSYNGHINLEMRALEDCEMTIAVISEKGTELFANQQSIEPGDHVLELNFPRIEPGNYYVRIETSEWIQFRKFRVE